jgi:hypothetical protein
MKISRQRLKKIIREEYRHALAEDAAGPIKRDSLKDMLDHENSEDVIHATHHAWAGGEHGGPEAENLVMPIDQADAAGSERATREPEMLDITGNLDENMGSSEPGTSSCGPDLDHDGVLSPDELHTHFDLEGDGIVTLDDYADHILWHERNPEALEDHEDEGGSTRMLDVLEKLGLI